MEFQLRVPVTADVVGNIKRTKMGLDKLVESDNTEMEQACYTISSEFEGAESFKRFIVRAKKHAGLYSKVTLETPLSFQGRLVLTGDVKWPLDMGEANPFVPISTIEQDKSWVCTVKMQTLSDLFEEFEKLTQEFCL